MNKHLLRTSLVVLSFTSALGRLSAQSPSPAPSSEEVLELERFKVTSGVTVEELVLPTARPFNSVFGTDDNIVDVPRNVTIISRQQLSDHLHRERARFLEAHLVGLHHDEFRRPFQRPASAANPPTFS